MTADPERIGKIERSSQLIGRAVISSVLVTLVSFSPILFLTGQEHKLFAPLVWTKTFAMIGSALVAVMLVPALMTLLLRGTVVTEAKHPVSRFFIWLYGPVLRWCLKWKKLTLALVLLLVIASTPVIIRIGTEFMPPLDEGSLLFMPVTLPDISNNEVKRLMQVQDRIIRSYPEVRNVLGKAGRANTATDNAPMSMIETIIILKPQHEWRKGVTRERIIRELNERLKIPGVMNSWTQPIVNRINMLSTGIRTDVGVKIYGQNLDSINALAQQFRTQLEGLEGVTDLYVEPMVGGKYLDIVIRKDQLGRYGLTVDDVNMEIETALGGMNATVTIEGRERYPVSVRLAQDFRNSVGMIGNLQIFSPGYGPIPLSAVADISFRDGAPMINSEDAMLRGTLLFNVRGRDMGSTVADAKKRLEEAVKKLPAGYYMEWSGQYENQVRAESRLRMIIPLVFVIIAFILYFTFLRLRDVVIVLASIPVALIGGVYSLIIFDVNFSVAVAVGFIALFGVAIETGVLMVVYLNHSLEAVRRTRQGQITRQHIEEGIYAGAVQRLRPKLMTVLVDVLGLLPVLLAAGPGSDVMKPITIPFVFGLLSSTVFVLVVLPVIYALVRERELAQTGTLRG